MAQLVLTTATSALSSFGSAVASTAASTIAGFAANTVSSLIFGPTKRRQEGPRLESFTVQASTEGAAILRTYGRTRLSGQVIWAANFKETISEDVVSSKGARLGTQTTSVNYIYSISLAIGLCEGEIARLGRVWADGKEFDLSTVNSRVYTGTKDQMPDGVIEAIEGTEAAPAFRELAYIVFEDLVLTEFGNRIPQFSFEVEKPLQDQDPDILENLIKAVTIIPSSGEFVYGTTPVVRILGEGINVSENIHHNNGGTDFTASMDALQGSLPNVGHTSLVVAWFGDDLRVGECQLRPGVETADKQNHPYDWSVSGEIREGAYLISQQDGELAYGGTPSDTAVIEALVDLGNRGLKVMYHPFILMDVPPNNSLPDPSGVGSQSAFPWRGRISADTIDGTASVTTEVNSFFGAASGTDYSVSEDVVVYTGPEEHSFRRMILHNAYLCKIANDKNPETVESFLIGSEMRGLTTLRDDTGAYPAVEQLQRLAADVRSILGSDVAISYGADWSEYFGHQPQDGSNDRLFHLDPLWSDENIDFIGIDNYMPLSDWRAGFAHLDAQEDRENGPYAINYLHQNMQGGEGYDWFYASDEDRLNQIRTPISDSQHGEDWIFRYKDLWNWWANPHHERIGNLRSQNPTDWVPQSKPFRFTELGCPAIDNGANQPNVFVDPGSSESAIPYFSDGTRDDLAQRRFIEAHKTFWRDPDNNPVSTFYDGPMVDPARAYIYAWDARPYPAFPTRSQVWGDTENWTLGHWLNGRVGRAPLDLLVRTLTAQADMHDVDAGLLYGVITGYIIDRPLSPREMIDPLADIFQFDMIESGGIIRFQSRDFQALIENDELMVLNNQLVAGTQEEAGNTPYTLTDLQSHDLPSAFRLGFLDEAADITPAVAMARDPGLRSVREETREVPIILAMEEAQARARSILSDAWVMRERIEFSLSPDMLHFEPGDIVSFSEGDSEQQFRITDIQDSDVRRIEAVRWSASVYEAPSGNPIFPDVTPRDSATGPVSWGLLDLPILGSDDKPGAPWFGAFANPWPGGVALYRQNGDSNTLASVAPAPASFGRIVEDLPPASSGRWIKQGIRLQVSRGAFSSLDREEVLSGANAIAVLSENGRYEVLQFLTAEIVGEHEWYLWGLLRGQAGSEQEALAGARAGARVVRLTPRASNALVQPDFPLDLVNTSLIWRAGDERSLPSSSLFTEEEVILEARNLKPLSPVHLRAIETGTDTHISWIRRTRIGGDNWAVEEVPLGEAFERYRVEIFDGDNVIRTQEVDQPYYLYRNADKAADLAVILAERDLFIRVTQLSDSVGMGSSSLPLRL